MIVSFERTGGFAGIRLFVRQDTAELPVEKAQKLEKLVEDADFFNLPASSPVPTRGADYSTYVVRVEDGDRKHEVRVTDLSLPDGFGPLIKMLTDLAVGR